MSIAKLRPAPEEEKPGCRKEAGRAGRGPAHRCQEESAARELHWANLEIASRKARGRASPPAARRRRQGSESPKRIGAESSLQLGGGCGHSEVGGGVCNQSNHCDQH